MLLRYAADGEAIAAYVNALDSAMKAFFANLGDPESAAAAAESRMASYVKNNEIIM